MLLLLMMMMILVQLRKAEYRKRHSLCSSLLVCFPSLFELQ
jgi:hypothetical protein